MTLNNLDTLEERIQKPGYLLFVVVVLLLLIVIYWIGVIVGALSAFGYRHEADRELLRDYIETQQEQEQQTDPFVPRGRRHRPADPTDQNLALQTRRTERS